MELQNELRDKMKERICYEKLINANKKREEFQK